MHQALVVTLVGPNRSGIVGRVADIVAAHEADWLESHMADLAGQFAGIVHVDVAPDRHDGLVSALNALASEGLTIAVADGRETVPSDGGDATAGRTLTLELTGLDHPGIVRDIGAALAAQGIDVRSLETDRLSGSMSGEMMFFARAELALPADLTLDALEVALEDVSNGLMIDIAEDDGRGDAGAP